MDAMKELQPLDIGVGLPAHEKQDAADVQAALGEALENRGVHFHAQEGGSGLGMLPTGPDQPLGAALTPAEAARQARLAYDLLRQEAAKFGESIREMFAVSDIRVAVREELERLAGKITTPLPGVTVTEMYARELEDKKRSFRAGIPRLRRGKLGSEELALDDEAMGVFGGASAEQLRQEQNTDIGSGLLNDNLEKLGAQPGTYAYYDEETKRYVISFAEDDARRLAKDPRIRRCVEPIRLTKEQLKTIQEGLETLQKELDTRIKATFGWYAFDGAYTSLPGFAEMSKVFFTMNPHDMKDMAEFPPTKEGGVGFGEEFQRSLRLNSLLAQVGMWMEIDRVLKRSPRFKVQVEDQRDWQTKLREIWEFQPEKYKMILDIKALDFVDKGDGRLKDGYDKEKLPQAQRNMVDFLETAALKIFCSRESLSKTEAPGQFRAWVRKIVCEEVVSEDASEEIKLALAAREEASQADVKAAEELAWRFFYTSGLAAMFDFNPGAGGIGAATTDARAEPTHAGSTFGLDTSRGENNASDVAALVREKLFGGAIKFPLERFWMSFLHMATVSEDVALDFPYAGTTAQEVAPIIRKDKQGKPFGARIDRTLWELWMLKGIEFNKLPWDKIGMGGWWGKSFEEANYLFRKGGFYELFTSPPRFRDFKDRLGPYNKACRKGVVFYHDGDIEGYIKRNPGFIKHLKDERKAEIAAQAQDGGKELTPWEQMADGQKGVNVTIEEAVSFARDLNPNAEWDSQQIMKWIHLRLKQMALVIMITRSYQKDAKEAVGEWGLFAQELGRPNEEKVAAPKVEARIKFDLASAQFLPISKKGEDSNWGGRDWAKWSWEEWNWVVEVSRQFLKNRGLF